MKPIISIGLSPKERKDFIEQGLDELQIEEMERIKRFETKIELLVSNQYDPQYSQSQFETILDNREDMKIGSGRNF